MTLPPRVGCTGPRTSRSSPFSNTYKILIWRVFDLQQTGGRRPPSYLLQFVGSQNFIKVERKIEDFQLPGREVLLFRATWREPRSDEHRRTRKESQEESSGPGPYPPRVGCTGPPEPPGALLLSRILINLTSHKCNR